MMRALATIFQSHDLRRGEGNRTMLTCWARQRARQGARRTKYNLSGSEKSTEIMFSEVAAPLLRSGAAYLPRGHNSYDASSQHNMPSINICRSIGSGSGVN